MPTDAVSRTANVGTVGTNLKKRLNDSSVVDDSHIYIHAEGASRTLAINNPIFDRIFLWLLFI